MPFDLSSIINDPTFQTGLGLMGAANPGNPSLSMAYKLLRDRQIQDTQNKRAEAMMQMEQQRTSLYGQQVQAQQLKNEMLQRRQVIGMQLLKQLGVPIEALTGDQGQQAPAGMPAPAAPDAPPEAQAPAGPSVTTSPVVEHTVEGTPLAPQAAGPQVQYGKHGTPVSILDNLMQTESGGNPMAIGPPIPGSNERALGPFQFLPSTIKMLKDQGITFNPFDVAQSRDAADYLLQRNLQQNGGDWNKAIAAYGGFKTKDPTAYVNKVMAGSPEQQARQHQEMVAENDRLAQLEAQAQQARKLQQGAGIMQWMNGDDSGLVEAAKATGPNLDIEKLRQGQQQISQGERRTQVLEHQEQRKTLEQTTKLNSEASKSVAAYQSLVQNNDVLRASIDKLRSDPNLKYVLGRGGLLPKEAVTIINPEWGNTIDEINQVVSTRINNILQNIRQNAVNGAAGFGQFQKFEHDMLGDIDSLKRTRTPEAFRGKLGEVEMKLDAFEKQVANTIKNTYGSDVPSAYEGLPPGSRYMGIDKQTNKPYYRLPDGTYKLRK